jgi:Zn-dependent peptidase ImmA (M78 family)
MQFIIDKVTKLRFDWNKRPLDETDFYRLCRRFKITVEEMPLSVGGFYYCLLGRHYIAISSKLPEREKLFVMFHELGHYLLHVPDTGVTANFHGIGKKTRVESEADIFALCCLIPIGMIEQRRGLRELAEIDGFDEETLTARIDVYERYGI